MEQDSSSFSADIKKYGETLAKDFKSSPFAPLSESVLAGDDAFFFADKSEIGESTLEYELALDDTDIIEELEELTDEFAEAGDGNTLAQFEISSENVNSVNKDPLKTATLAELYVSQGVLVQALTIYQELLKIEPSNLEFKKRVAEIQQALAAEEPTEEVLGGVISKAEELPGIGCIKPEPATTGSDNDNVAKLEKWLENIKRGR